MHRQTQYTIIRSCIQAEHAPTSHDDTNTGIIVGLQWQDNSSNPPKRYVCVSIEPGAAIWEPTSGSVGGGVTSVNTRDGDVVLSGSDIPIFHHSGVGHAAGAVPDPGASAGTTKFLREDATWAVPAGGGGAVASVNSRTGAITLSGADIPVFVASGVGDAPGAVPAPGSSAGTTKFLREDATWAVPANGGSVGSVQVAFGDGSGGLTSTAGVVVGGGSVGLGGLQLANQYYLSWTDPAGYNAQLGSDSSGILALFGTDSSGGAVEILEVPLATDAPALKFKRPIIIDGTQGDVQINDQDGRDPPWHIRVQNGEFYVVSDSSGFNVFHLQTGGDLTLTGQLNVAAVPNLPASIITSGTFAPAQLTALGASGSSSSAGIAPDPGGVAGTTKFLREDATWALPPSAPVTSVNTRTGDIVLAGTDIPTFVASGASHAAGAVPAPSVTAGTTHFLREDATWALPPSAPVTSVNTRTGAITLGAADIPAFIASGASHAAGAVPDPGSSAGSTKFLREDATWAVPASAVTTVNTRSGAVVLTGADIPTFVASGASHAVGSVPDPGAVAGTTKFLREDATWALPPSAPVTSVNTRTGAITLVATDLPTFVASGASHAGGAVPDPGVTAGTAKFLREDATWALPPSAPVSSVNTRTGAIVLTGADIPAFVASGVSHAAGAVPDPGSSAGTVKFLREDATWTVPAYPVTSVNTRAGAITLVATDIPVFVASGASHAVGAVPDPGVTSGTTRFLREDATWSTPPAAPVSSVNTRTGSITLVATDIPTFVASGASHAAGAVPDPGVTSGSTKFLREDATWSVPPSAPVSSVNTRTGAITLVAADIPVFLASGPSHAVGTVPDPGSSAGTIRYLREDATWVAPTVAPGITSSFPATANATITSSTAYVEYSGPGGTLTLPAANALSPLSVSVIVKNKSTSPVTVAAAGSDTIEDGVATTFSLASGASFNFISNTSNAWSLN